MKLKHILIITVISIAFYILGVKSYSLNIFPYPQYKATSNLIRNEINIVNKQEVNIKTIKGKTLTVLVFGQSNAANYGEIKYTSKRNVYNYYYVNSKIYKASDPLVGADGQGGSVWSRLGDKIVEKGIYDNVIFVPIGIGDSEIKRWSLGGDLNSRITESIASVKKSGLSIDYILFHQGETDATLHTSKEDYKKHFTSIVNQIKSNGVDCPIYIALATEKREPSGFDIYNAQMELIDNKTVFAGPKVFDDIRNLDDRYQYVHFSDSGLNKLADLWADSIFKL